MAALATLAIKKEDFAQVILSPAHLYETRDLEDGALRQVLDWLYEQEGGNHFDQKHMKIGSQDSDYAMLYYFEGKRYKVLRNGKAYISGADADEMFEEEEKELQQVIDTILNDEIRKRIVRAASASGAKSGRAKSAAEQENIRVKTIFGIAN